MIFSSPDSPQRLGLKQSDERTRYRAIKRDDQMIRLPRASARNAPQTQNRKRLLAEITSEQIGLCSRDYRRHLAVCEEYGAEPTNFAIFTIEFEFAGAAFDRGRDHDDPHA